MTKSWTEGLEVDTGEDLTEQIINAILLALKGYYVIEGLEAAQAVLGSKVYVDVSTGRAWCETEAEEHTKDTEQGDVGPFSPSATGYERFDLITINTTGLHIIAGTEQTQVSNSAVPPDIPEDDVILAVIYVNDDVPTEINTADIQDHRVFGNTVQEDEIFDNAFKYYLVETIHIWSSKDDYIEQFFGEDWEFIKEFRYYTPQHGLEPTTDIRVEAVFEVMTEDGGTCDLKVTYGGQVIADFAVDVDHNYWTAWVVQDLETVPPADGETIRAEFKGSGIEPSGEWARCRGVWLNIYAKLT